METLSIAIVAPEVPPTLQAVTDAVNAADKGFVSSIERTGPYTFLVEIPDIFGNKTLVQEFITKLTGQIFGGWILSAELASETKFVLYTDFLFDPDYLPEILAPFGDLLWYKFRGHTSVIDVQLCNLRRRMPFYIMISDFDMCHVRVLGERIDVQIVEEDECFEAPKVLDTENLPLNHPLKGTTVSTRRSVLVKHRHYINMLNISPSKHRHDIVCQGTNPCTQNLTKNTYTAFKIRRGDMGSK